MDNNSNVTEKPLPPYFGSEPYIYVSYAPEDKYAVYPEIKRFQNQGFNVFYDEKCGDIKVKELENCTVFIIFLTPNSAKLDRILEEVEFAEENQINILPIYLVETELDPLLDFTLSEINSISKFKWDLEKYTSQYMESFKGFGLKSNKNSLKSKLVPGQGRVPFPAYRGEGSYMFISYAHKDSDIVFPEIKRFQDMGYNVWYDEGIGAGNEWLKDVVNHLVESDLFVVFITRNSVASKNVRKEIKYAIHKDKNILPIFLEDFDNIDMESDLEYELSVIQAIIKTTLNEDEYIFKFTEAFHHFGFEPSNEVDEELFERIELKNPKDVLIDNSLEYDILYSDLDSDCIKPFLDDFFENLAIYDDFHNNHYYKEILKSSIEVFLENKSFYDAYEVYKIFFGIYQILERDKSSDRGFSDNLDNEPNTILELIEVIIKYASMIYRDSNQFKKIFIHSVNVFILGLIVYSQNKNYKEFFKNYVQNSPYEKYYIDSYGELSDEEFLYRWGLASLLHDIYLPLENIGENWNKRLYEEFDLILGKTRIIEDFNDLNEIYKKDYYFKENFENTYNYTKFFDLFKPTDIMAHKISLDFPDLDLKLLVGNLNNFIDLMHESEFMEHGLLAAFLVLDSYGYQIQEYAKDSSFFFYPVVDSATAIFLHNYYRYFLQNEPFNLKQLYPQDSPLAYLLIFCDNILEFYKKPETIIDENINEITNLQFDGDGFYAENHVKSFSYGFAFSNELSLDELLDTTSIFNGGVSVNLDLNNLHNINEIFKFDGGLYDYHMKNVEKIAIQLHQTDIDSVTREYEEKLANGTLDGNTKAKFEGLTDFDGLSYVLKIANFRQALSIPKKLNLIGCEIVAMDDERESILEFSDDDIITLARFEHQEWCKQKIDQGWTYGPVRNVDELIHDCLVPWEELPSMFQQYDIDSVKYIPELVINSGFKIVLSKLKLLTFQLYKFSENIDDDLEVKQIFDNLHYQLKELNLKKTDLIIESLSNLNYMVVDKSHRCEPVVSFNDDERKYFAQYVHDEWCNLNNSLGWRFGDYYDLDLKINPNLKSWENLSPDYAKMQVDIFNVLPQFCDGVGLKIIKNNYE